ncbi:hypothetical protein OSCI_250011 [Kamptonema sp. PCC 6506]|nr:hypothetical protein OSCI_250011 [Kamptonema sp. PCC 6506]
MLATLIYYTNTTELSRGLGNFFLAPAPTLDEKLLLYKNDKKPLLYKAGVFCY